MDLTTVEFTIIGFASFLVVLGLAEMGRLLWVWDSREASDIPDGLSTGQVSVSYLHENGGARGNWCEIDYVCVRSRSYAHNFIVTLVGSFLNAPDFVTTLPAESPGLVSGVGLHCFGVASAAPSCS